MKPTPLPYVSQLVDEQTDPTPEALGILSPEEARIGLHLRHHPARALDDYVDFDSRR